MTETDEKVVFHKMNRENCGGLRVFFFPRTPTIRSNALKVYFGLVWFFGVENDVF